MKKVWFSMLIIGLMMLCVACESKNEVASLSPEEQQFNNYTTICNRVSSKENHLAELIILAGDKVKNTQENDVADVTVLESLSSILIEAMNYSNYSPVSLESKDADISSEITAVEERSNYLSEINQTLENALKNVDNSIDEKKDALIWPGKTFTHETEDADGYVVEVKMKFGSWIRASDTENLNKAWQRAGGKGSAPDISTFSLYGEKFRGDNAVMTFATLEYTNKTKGYDFTEQYPHKCVASCTRLEVPSSSNHAWQGYIYFSNGPLAMNGESGWITTSMTKNHWGPITLAFAVSNIFGPKYDEMGNPDLDKTYFYFGDEKFRIPAIWKTNENIVD